MFDVDVTTCVALFLTNILHLKPFFTVEKYQFYSHLICIEFTACDKINTEHLQPHDSKSATESKATRVNVGTFGHSRVQLFLGTHHAVQCNVSNDI